MPLYDLVVMVKPLVQKREVVDILKGVASQVYAGNGVVTDVKSFGRVALAYRIKKRDGWHSEGQMLQLTAMASPQLSSQLEALNQDERLLRWILVANRGTRWLRGANTRDAAAAAGGGLFPLEAASFQP